MTEPKELLRAGDIAGARAVLTKQVRSEPANAKHRVFLFQLLALQGEWDRALNQLNVAGELDAAMLGMVAMYRDALSSEALRADVFAGKRTPLLFAEPEQWIALLLEALRVEGAGEVAQAEDLRGQALEAAPPSAGTLAVAGAEDGSTESFEWLADADLRLGPMFEVVMKGQYYWVPVHHVQTMTIDPPEDLRDLVWTPAMFTWTNGGEAVGLVPTRYPGTEQSDDSALLLSRKTIWQPAGDSQIGLGQRLLATNETDYSLLDVRSLTLDSGTGPAVAVNGP